MTPHPEHAVRRFIFICMLMVPAVPFLVMLGIGYVFFSRFLERMHRLFALPEQTSDAFVGLGLFDTDGDHLSYTGPLAGIVREQDLFFEMERILSTRHQEVSP